MTRRALRTLVLALPLSSSLLLGTAAPALAAAAAGTISLSPTGVIDAGNPTATVNIPKSCGPLGTNCQGPGSLSVVRPDGKAGDLLNSSNQTSSSQSVPADGQNHAFTVLANQVRSTVKNGTWKVTLNDYGGSTTKTFVTDFVPAAPTSVSASAMGQSQVDVTWKRGSEPDLTGFVVDDGAGGKRTLDTSVCASQSAGATCEVVNTYQNTTPGTYDYSFTVVALRASGQAGHADLSSPASDPAAKAELVTPQPTPSPTPSASPSSSPAPGSGTGTTTSGTTGGGTTGGGTKPGATGGTTSGSTQAGRSGSSGKPLKVPSLPELAAQRKAFALSFNHFSPSLDIPKLPPLPTITVPVTAAATDGGYQPVLPYKPQAQKPTTSVFASSPLAAVTQLDTKQLAPPLAMALIVLLTAGHVRLFLSRHAED